MKFTSMKLLSSSAILLAMTAPVLAQQTQPQSVRAGNSLDANSIQGMTAPKYSKSTPMGGVDYGDDLGNHQASKALDLSSFGIYNLGDPTSDRPDMAANKRYVDQVGQASKDNLGNHTATQNITMGGYQLNGLSTPTGNAQAATKKYVDDKAAASMDNLGNHTAEQALDLDGFRVIDLGAPINPNDAANKAYVDAVGTASQDNLGNHTATTVLNMSNQKISNLGAPTAATDAATKGYVDGVTSTINNNIGQLTGRRINAGTGLSGGGALSSDVTIAFDTSWGDGRYALSGRSILAGDGLSGGGNLSANRTLSVDGTVVRTSGNQSIGGLKTFTDGINNGGKVLGGVATPTADAHAANKGYVDTAVTSAVTAAAYTAGNGLSLAGRQFSVDTGVVATLAGAQTLSGAKTFTGATAFTRSGSQLRIKHTDAASAAAIFHNNGNQLFVLLTDPGSPDAGYNALRPLSINNTTGAVNLGNGLTVSGGAVINGGLSTAGSRVTNVATPTAGNDAATKAYVDGVRTDLDASIGAITARSVIAGTGLQGGGPLTGNVTLSVNGTVMLTNNAQTISGAKTFTANIAMSNNKITGLGTPTAAADAATKAYVDSAVSGASGGVPATRTIATTNGLTGGGDLSANRTLQVDGTVVRTTGDQDIQGVKIFRHTPRFANNIRVTNGESGRGFFIHNNGNQTHFLLTDDGQAASGGWNGARPMFIHNADGFVEMHSGLRIQGGPGHEGSFFSGDWMNPWSQWRLNFNGSLFATRYYSTMYLYFSDRNLKKDIEPISKETGIETVRDLKPVSYRWKRDDKLAWGVIAQEIEEVMPQAVVTTEDGTKAVDYQQIIAPMLAAIQDLDDRAAKSDARVKELEDRLGALEVDK